VPEPILTIRDLAVEFDTEDGVVHAVANLSYDLHLGRCSELSASLAPGKRVDALGARADPRAPGSDRQWGVDLQRARTCRKLQKDRLRAVRGEPIAMIF